MSEVRYVQRDSGGTITGVFALPQQGNAEEAVQWPIPLTFSDNKAAKLTALAAHRYAVETGGITLAGGTKIRTDRESQALINGAYNLAGSGAVTVVKFKGQDGFTSLTVVQVQQIATAVGLHVQACFAHESDLTDQINAAADQAALDAIDITTGWPI